MKTIHYIIIIVLLLPVALQSQNNDFQKLKNLYQKNQYEVCYNKASEISNPKAGTLLMKALAFNRLDEKGDIKKSFDDPMLYTLQLIKEAKNITQKAGINDSAFFVNEFKKIQTPIFEKAEKWYNNGLKKRAREYFDAIHHTFDNSKTIYINHFGFDDEYFVNILKENIEVPEEFYSYYKQKYNLLEKYYYSLDKYEEWNNPVYRMANTAKNADYENYDEKMVFYFLNLVRMNPELFNETFLHTRLNIRFHGSLDLKVPKYDTLLVNKYSENLTFDEFFELPVHKLFNNDLPEKTIGKFVDKKIIRKTPESTRYRFDINYHEFYKYLKNNRPALLNLKNLSNYQKTDQGQEIILFKLYDKKYTVYNKKYEEGTNDHYHQSLFTKLEEMEPEDIIRPDRELFKLAECWAIEAGKRDLKGHDRINCPYGYHSECCDYGNKNGFDVVISLLIDQYVPDLGHRKILLGNFREMGVAIRPHDSGFKYNAVLDFYR